MTALEARRQELRRIAAEEATALAAELAPIIEDLTQARACHDWARADAIKNQLAQRSVTVQITKHGITWYR